MQIEQNEVKQEIMNLTTYGSLMTFSEVKCPLEHMNVNESQTFPVVDAYLVSVSFDAVKYSTGSPIIVYDSTCTICKGVKGIVDCKMRVSTYYKTMISDIKTSNLTSSQFVHVVYNVCFFGS